ncbi:MAG: DUF2283 domain-containing protein [Chloroflexi bacterium]|nr:DUF2283 domain-containing protein [Chloroflexota bacterium]
METILKLDDERGVNWDYDEEADVLYISFGSPRPGVGIDMGEGLVIMHDEKSGEIVGITLIGARDMLEARTGPRAPVSPK